MKKSMMLLGMVTMVALAACNINNPKEEQKTATPPPAAQQTTPPPSTEQKNGTTIKLDGSGVSVESKDGSRKNNVSVSKDSTRIEISRPK